MINGPVYPSYVSFDCFIDTARLRALDNYLRDKLQHRLENETDRSFHTGPFTLEGDAPKQPGTRMVNLARSALPEQYYDLDHTELWSRSEEASGFGELMEFIDTLPFEATARIIIMYDPEGRAVTAHRDHDSSDLCHEFVWFRTNLAKPFYMLDPATGERRYVHGYSAWFDTVNQYHGGDATGELAWSIRVDGRFTDAFRALMPPAPGNAASRPALWAARG